MLLDNHQDFLIHQIKRKAFFEMNKAHYHLHYELYYLLSGKRKVFINHTLYTAEKGSLIIIAKGNLHRTTFATDDPHERVVINFTDRFLEPLFEELGRENVIKCFENAHLLIPIGRRQYVEELFQKIKYEYDAQDSFSEFLMRNHVYELIVFLIRAQSFQKNSIEEIDSSIGGKVQEMAKYICDNYDKPITLEEMARKANMSTTYFSKKFKKITGFGFKEYLNNIRLKEASHLLLETKETVTQIALRCGFADSNYFGDVFKKMKGISPMQYRKNKGAL